VTDVISVKTEHDADLRVSDLSVSYGVGFALREFSAEVMKDEIVAILGVNGSGKSTLLRTIMGLNRPRGGSISLFGEPITNLPTIQRVRRGLGLVPEGRRIFTQLTVEENLSLSTAPWRRFGQRIDSALDEIYELFPILHERRSNSASALSGGQQQMLAIGRALIARPKVLLLDEPTLGLAPVIVRTLMDVLTRLSGDGLTVIIAEQNVHQVLRIADRAYVLQNGRLVLAATASELVDSPELAAAYL
jgi:branched-chain amino acid transport system ATP-binding protein